MVSDKMLRSAPSVEEGRQFAIPSRSSSISRTNSRFSLREHNTTVRQHRAEENSNRLSFLDNDPSAANTRSASSRPTSRTHSPSRMIGRSMSCSASSRTPTQQRTTVQRWDGLTRSVSNWDGLRRDSELWIENSDCLVHLYARGASRRGPSFCVPLRALRQKGCSAMLDICYTQTTVETSTGSFESRRMRTFDNLNRESYVAEIYIPAPEHASREDAFGWHLATRNFFAFVLGKPLVGRQMGPAFVDLLERMKLFRYEHTNNHQDFLDYAENQGYRDLVECTDYALASLYYAERYKLRDVWVDAFAHCVGMSDSIALSPEYMTISQLSKALITRAHLEVDVHVGGVAKALRNFLQEDFSPAYLGLADGARNHLHRFQRFLHHFYVEKFGYWPPPKSAQFSKALYKSMFYDFKSLYDLLVDAHSNTDIAFQGLASGGLCVLQTVDHFDKRHKFTAQQHPLPLLPSGLDQPPARSLSSASHQKKGRGTQLRSAALAAATNGLSTDTEQPKIVKAYMDFGQTYTAKSAQREDRITAVDARKVEWLLIYGMLQYLTSVLRAPDGVRDVESPDYPLCCFVAGQPASSGTPISTPPVASPFGASRAMNDYFEGAQCTPISTIQPDCHREDYFTSQTAAKRNNAENLVLPKPHLPLRQPSLRAFGQLTSLSTRSSRRNSLVLKPTSHCAIIVHGYGDGLNQATVPASSQTVIESSDLADSHRLAESNTEIGWLKPQAPPAPVNKPFTVRSHNRTRTPLLHTTQLDHTVSTPDSDDSSDSMSRSDSTGSKSSSIWTDEGSAASSKSSADSERRQFYKASTAEHSGLLGGLVSTDGIRVSLDVSEDRSSIRGASQQDIHPLLRQSYVEQHGFQFDFGVRDLEVLEPADTTGSIGMAFSAPPSPSINSAAAPHKTMSLISQKHLPTAGTNTPKPIMALEVGQRKKNRSSDLFSGLVSTPGELRDRYTNAIKRLENSSNSTTKYDDLCKAPTQDVRTPIVTKTSHATKTPSLRNRIWHDDSKDKKERRMSSLWRR